MAKIAEMFVELGLKKDKFDKGMKDAADAPKKLGGGFTGMGVAMTAAFAVGSAALMGFTKKALEAYDAQAKAETGLLNALKGRTIMQELLIAQANEMQKTTLFEDDAIIQAQKFLATMGLTTQQIHDLMPLLADFSTSTGMDLVQAANLAAKAIGTGTNALGRYGVELDSTMSKNQKANEIMAVFTERYGGQAEAAAKVGTSAIALMTKAWGEAAEMIGKKVAPAFTVLAETITAYLGVFEEEDPNQWVNDQIAAFGKLDEAAKKSKIAWWFKQAKDAQEDYIKLLAQAGRYEIAAQSDNSKAMKNAIKQTADMIANKKKEIDDYAKLIKGIRQYGEVNDTVTEELETQLGIYGELNEKIKNYTALIDTATSEQQIAFYRQELELLKMKLETLDKIGVAMKNMEPLAPPSSVDASLQQQANRGRHGKSGAPTYRSGAQSTIGDDVSNAFDMTLGEMQDFTSSFDSMVNEFIAGTITDFANALGEALITGDMDGYFSNILAAFGSFLSQLGEMMIAYGVAALALSVLGENPTPMAAIALIAAGATMAVLGSAISKSMEAGPGGTAGMSGGGGSMSGGNYQPIQGNSDMTLRTEISGSDLAFILERANRTSQRNGRF